MENLEGLEVHKQDCFFDRENLSDKFSLLFLPIFTVKYVKHNGFLVETTVNLDSRDKIPKWNRRK